MSSRRRISPARLSVLAVLLAACGDADGGRTDRIDSVAAIPPPRHVVVVLLDTLRADRLGLYSDADSAEEEASPFIDSLAGESVVFDAASAPAPWTLPSVVSLMLSRFAGEHSVVRDKDVIDPTSEPLAERLRAAGFRTVNLFRNPYAGELTGLDRGFDRCELVEHEVGSEAVDEVFAAAEDEPLFLYVHNTGSHDPYNPNARFVDLEPLPTGETMEEINELQDTYRLLGRRNYKALQLPELPDNSEEQTEYRLALAEHREVIEELYQGEVRECDVLVSRIVQALRDRGVWDETLFVLLSDHGEELGERGGWMHDHSAYEELLHVPLLIHFPAGAFGGTRVARPVSLVDVMPTILETLGLATDGCDGQSLLPLLGGAGDPGETRLVAHRLNRKKYYAPYKRERGDENLVARSGSWKAIWNVEPDTFELYDLANDPGELHDVSAEHPERAAAMRAFLERERERLLASAWRQVPDETDEVDPRVLDVLRELGYLGEDETDDEAGDG